MSRSGFRLNIDPKSDWLISVNHNQAEYQRFISNGGVASRAILLRDEPVSVFPAQFSSKIEKLYSLVLTPGLRKELSGKSFFIPWPYESNANPNTPKYSDLNMLSQQLLESSSTSLDKWLLRRNHIVVISSNKVSTKKSVFHEFRRMVGHEAEKLGLLIYGDLWSSSLKDKIKHRVGVLVFGLRSRSSISLVSIYGKLHWRYRSCGAVEDKFEVLLNSRISVVLENSDTTISEKLFDSIIAGCVPIYAGPKLSNVELPEDIALQCAPDIATLSNLINNTSKEQIEMVRQRGQNFIRSEEFKSNWSSEAVNKFLCSLILEHILSYENQANNKF